MSDSDLKVHFDAVVFLTWSNWHVEPRSNRYHYATRFARHLPVIFVQPDAPGDTIFAENVHGHDIEILHIPSIYGLAQSRQLERALAERRINRPLLWIYNAYFKEFVVRSSAPLRIYHATEDYLSPPETIHIASQDVVAPLQEMLRAVDLVLAVSDGVADSYLRHGCESKIIILPNGCDFDYWAESEANDYQSPESNRPVAFYQGGVNSRLDLALLSELVERMPDWDLWLCGKLASDLAGWNALQSRTNVRYWGMLDLDGVAKLARKARVGLIPFMQERVMRRSLPLKAYEYLACGLPVVTVPIDALSVRPDLFQIATDAAGFERAIRALSASRVDPAAVDRRLCAARKQSYDLHFERLMQILDERMTCFPKSRPRLNVLMFYDDRATHISTVKEHLDAFAQHSRHRYYFLPGTGFVEGIDGSLDAADFGVFDALVIHYSVRVALNDYISRGVANLVAAYAGPKLLFIQDEYERTETARNWIDRLGISAIYTTVPLDELDKVYPRARFPKVDFLPTLTGYVPDDKALDRFIKPLAERSIAIGYRGRILPYQYGELGQEKYRIGVEMKRLAEAAGVPVDIEVDDGKRIYGSNWYQFLGSCRTMLGTESGANVFDDDGSLAEAAKVHADMPYAEFAVEFLAEHEGHVRMNQISPKLFEAIRLQTALILFEGNYSGVLQPDRHYIPLKKDFSNIADVFAKIADLDYLRALTTRAHDEIIGSGRFSYATFVDGVDRYLEGRCPRGARATLLSAPVLVRFDQHLEFLPFRPTSPLLADKTFSSSNSARSELLALRAALCLEAAAEATEPAVPRLETAPEAADPAAPTEASPTSDAISADPTERFVMIAAVRRIWRLLPAGYRYRLAIRLGAVVTQRERQESLPFAVSLLWPLCRLLPARLRHFVVSRLR